MNWFKNFKIANKLIISFMIIALIAAAIGTIGLLQMYKIETHVDELGKVRLPSIENLLIISEGQTALRLEEKALLDAALNHEERLEIFAEVETIQTRIDKAWDVYAVLPQSIEESNEWEKFTKLWKTWHDRFDEYIVLAKELDASTSTLAKNNLLKELRDLSFHENTDTFYEAEASLYKIIKINESISEEAIQASHDAHDRSVWIVILSIGFGVLISIALALYISKLIGKPISSILKAALEIADGNLDVKIDVSSKDEIGQLGHAFEQMTANINHVMSNINNASDQVAAGSRQLSDSSMSLSQGATEQASSIEELTASVEEISSQTKANADNADQAKNMADTAFGNAEKGNQHMVDMLKAMNDINESSSNISRIIKVIDDIAFQTNILALNAAVEAARAGQHGKGFAVVAEEVRNLAARSANAAKETTTMIEGSIEKVEDGTKIANETAKALDEIVKDIGEVTNLISNIALASNEQALGVEQINQGLMQISNVVQTTSATAEETASASEELSGQADMLKAQVSTFKLKAYVTDTEINPDVAKVLENMGQQKVSESNSIEKPIVPDETVMKKKEEIDTTKVNQIKLSDNEFEKY